MRAPGRGGGAARLAAAGVLVLATRGAFSAEPASAPPAADDDARPAGIYGVDSDGDDEDTETLPPPAAAAAGASPRGGARSTPASANYTIRRGDTLWDISNTFFQSPWQWPKIWALNPEITNPHWIFPGQSIRLRDTGAAQPVAAATPAPAQEATASSPPVPPPRPPRPAVTLTDSPDLRQLGFVDEGALKAAGVINGSIEEKILLASGDQAYVEFPAGRQPKGGARYSVYQVDVDHPVKEPGSAVVLGYLVHVYGEVVIDGLTDRPVANARLVNLAEPVERGYRVGPLVHQMRSVLVKPNGASMTARIVAAVDPNNLIANQMFVVLNRGRRHGVDVGNRFLVLRQGDGLKRILESWDAMDHRFPPHAVAEITAVDVQNETTVGWISHGSRELHVGDVADMQRGY